MEKGIITLSFDDARKDTFHVFKDILTPRGLSGVVYVPSGYVETGFNDPQEIGFNGIMSKKELDWIYNNSLFEVGCHGYLHRNDFDDLKKGVEKLQEWYPDYKEYGLASPHSQINKSLVEKEKIEFRSLGFSYVRGGRNFEKNTSLKRGMSLLARKTKLPKLFVYTYKNSVNHRGDYYLHAVPIHKLTTLEQVKAMIDYTVEKKCWTILEFHGIDKINSQEYTEEFCWLENDFIHLCDYIKNLCSKGILENRNPIVFFQHKNLN